MISWAEKKEIDKRYKAVLETADILRKNPFASIYRPLDELILFIEAISADPDMDSVVKKYLLKADDEAFRFLYTKVSKRDFSANELREKSIHHPSDTLSFDDPDLCIDYAKKLNRVISGIEVTQIDEDGDKVIVVITNQGISLKDKANLNYPISGNRKKIVLELSSVYPDGMTGKTLAKCIGMKASEARRLNSPKNKINELFKDKLSTKSNLILGGNETSNGYALNGRDFTFEFDYR